MPCTHSKLLCGHKTRKLLLQDILITLPLLELSTNLFTRVRPQGEYHTGEEQDVAVNCKW